MNVFVSTTEYRFEIVFIDYEYNFDTVITSPGGGQKKQHQP